MAKIVFLINKLWYILKAIKNATFYKAFLMQKVYMILEAMAIKVKNFC